MPVLVTGEPTVSSCVLVSEPTTKPPTSMIELGNGKVCAVPNDCPIGGTKLRVPSVSMSKKPVLLLKLVPVDLIVTSPPGSPAMGS